jgi:hypothetical protein
MYKRPSKRQQAIRRAVIYTIMTMTVIGVTALLMLFMIGYRFNKDQGTFQQGGLVQFISQPTGASVTVGQARLANKTRSKITLNPGDYLVKMERDGYVPWQKNVTVEAGEVLWLNSALLVPENPQTNSLMTFDTLSSAAFRNDGKYLAFIENASRPQIQIATTSAGRIADTIRLDLPSDVYAAGKKHEFTLDRWDSDSDWFFLKHTIGKKTEWIVVDRADADKAVRIPNAGKATAEDVLFDPRSNNQVIVRYSDGTVRGMTLNDEKVSKAVIEKAADISLGSNWTVVYTTEPVKNKISVGYLTLGAAKPRLLGSYNANEPVTAAIGNYYYVTYLAVSHGSTTDISQINDWPRSDSDAPLQTKSVSELSHSTETNFTSIQGLSRFVVMQHDKTMTVYDLELNQEYDIPIAGVEKRLEQPLSWSDHFHFWSDATGHLRQYEFDGTNQTSITSVAPGFDAGYDSSKEFLYSIGKTKTGYSVQSTSMRVE